MIQVGNKIFHGDCLKILDTLKENSIEAIVTDPPYELGFMGKAWDKAGVSFKRNTWEKCLRVLKPGGHLLAFGGTRTYHRITVAIEDAGFEIRDSIAWIYGSGFPKSLDVSKAIDKGEGIWRGKAGAVSSGNDSMENPNYERTPKGNPVTDNAKKWEGWGTGLKPSMEPICLARKPLSESTVAANVLKWGTGALNIDGSRIAGEVPKTIQGKSDSKYGGGKGFAPNGYQESDPSPLGRWPANLIIDGSEEVERGFPETKTGDIRKGLYKNISKNSVNCYGDYGSFDNAEHRGDSGSASRFFYTAKASKWERENHNKHPTVKPIALMEYLIKLVTPKGGTVLDPFAGSGSTLIAAKKLGRKYIGIEMNPEDIETTKKRLSRAAYQREVFT